jgi:zinc protease
LGVEKIDEKDAYKVEVVKPNGKKHFEWFDVGTSFQVMSEITEDGETAVTKFSDYKEIETKKVGKIKFPNKVTLNAGGIVIDFTAKEILVNSKLDAELFSTK